MNRHSALARSKILNRLMSAGALLFWVGAAALAGTFVLGCQNNTGEGTAPNLSGTMAIALGGQIKVFTQIGDLIYNGSAPVPTQTISAPNVLSLAFDSSGNLYYLANNGSAGSDATFYSCPRSNSGVLFPSCAAVGNPIAGGQWLSVNTAGAVFATSLTGNAGLIISFPAASGPPAFPTIVYASTTLPAAYGGITVDGSGTVYVTEQPTAGGTPRDKLFACSTACQGSSGSQVEITSIITGSYPSSYPGGPLAMAADGTTLLVGASNTNPMALTAPVAFVCTSSGGSGLSCQAGNETFPPLAGVDTPFITTVGIAISPSNNVYDAVLLTDGNTTDSTGPSFFGFVSTGGQFACSGSPNCRVSQLPSVPVNSAPGSVPYGLAVSPIP